MSFIHTFMSENAHNMIVLMVDLHFKGLEYVVVYTWIVKTWAIVREYDVKVVIRNLVKVRYLYYFAFLNV